MFTSVCNPATIFQTEMNKLHILPVENNLTLSVAAIVALNDILDCFFISATSPMLKYMPLWWDVAENGNLPKCTSLQPDK